MGDRRRTIQSSHQPSGGGGGNVPSSIPRPSNASLRQSLAPTSTSSRQSLLPQQQQSMRGRQSIAPYPSSSQEFIGSSQSSQGGGVFSQGHGGPPPPPPSTISRNNNMYTSHSMGSMSVSRNQPTLMSSRSSFAQSGGGGGNTLNFDYVPPSERRVSTYHSSRRSTIGGNQQQQLPLGGPNSGGGPPLPPGGVLMTPGGAGAGISSSTLVRPSKDPREVRPRRAQERHAEEILNFLSTHQCPFSMSLQNLLGPTSNHFTQLFTFLTKLFDPSINFGSSSSSSTQTGKGSQGGQKMKFEDEVLQTLRTVQYPFTDSITKSHLQSIGSMQSWPNMLAMLHWLAVTIDAREIAFNSDPELQMPLPESQLPLLPFEEVTSHAWFHFLNKSYDKFIAGQDEEEWEIDLEELKTYQNQATEVQRGRIEDLRGEFQDLETEWNQLCQTQDPIIAFKTKQAEVERDIERLNNWRISIEKKNSSYLQNCKLLEQVISSSLEERDLKKTQQERLELQVKSQSLTPYEINSLNQERQNLMKSLQEVQKRYRLMTEKKMSLEVDLQVQLDQASKLCILYEEIATPLGILDGPVQVPGFGKDGEPVLFGQEINGASENPVPEGISTVVKPALQKLRQGTKEEINQLRQAQVNLEEEMTKLREILQEFGDVQTGLELELEAVDREKLDLNERFEREMHATGLELERLQQQVHAANSTADHALLQATHRYDQRVLERRSVKQQTEEIRAKNRQALEAAMDSFVTYKEHMSSGTQTMVALINEAEEDSQKLKQVSR
ncbi:hypothetical protein JCM5350_007361 [Sporobolomyces pararoseus]